MMTDIEIADQAQMRPISEIAAQIGLSEDEIEQYGKYKAKITLPVTAHPDKKHKLVLVTSINPTPAGEGKSTVLVGLGDAMNQLGHQTIIAMREPSMGPVFGIKGGATGGGYSQVVPMEDINLHFTGDLHALTSANNTLAALVDNYIMRDNELGLDPRRIIWKRVEDVNDRALRNVVTGLGGIMQGVPRQTGFDITAASEMMAILCLSTDLMDLKRRVGKIVVGYTYDKQPVTVAQLHFEDAITILLKDAIKPNLVQTLDHTPTIIHGGHSPTSLTAATVSWPPRQPSSWPTTRSPSPASGPTWGRRSSWTSSAVSSVRTRTPWSSSPRSGPSSTTGVPSWPT